MFGDMVILSDDVKLSNLLPLRSKARGYQSCLAPPTDKYNFETLKS